ncbi:hypothetical protein AWU67_08360 [Microterricola viridarii]|uniref:Phage shock protein A (PspA) family protein n=2 Tax=Microterricola viridarii TaxID=412690 RepID=A0A120I124_9MICO|nr:hypothetical protein AWU67_08360 [Microterricola viridarii]
MEDPRDALDDSYEQQVKLLHEVRGAVAEVATAKKRIELQGEEMGARHRRLGEQATEAMAQGREDLARAALQRRASLEGQVAKLQEQHASLQAQTSQLQERERRLAEQIAAFRVEKETLKATYSASEAQVRANESVAGIGANMNDVGAGLDRARDRVTQMQARAQATGDLLASGALQDLTAAPDADIERQLSELASRADIERQLNALKAEGGEGGRGSGMTVHSPDGWLSIGQAPPTP